MRRLVDSNLTLSVMTDLELVRRFMILDEIFSLAMDDSGVVEEYYPPNGSDKIWLGVFEGFEIIGLVYVHSQTSSTIQMHPYLLNGHKHKVRELGKVFFKWAFSLPMINKVNVTVPFIYHKLRNCCLKCGYKDEGINRVAYLKHGIFHDQWYMGITREDYEQS